MGKNIKKQEINEVEDLELAQAAGGGIFHATGAAADENRRWEVIHEDGSCHGVRFSSEKEAKQYCELNGITTNRIWFYDTLRDMRRAYIDHKRHTPELKNWKNPYGHSWYS